MQLDKQVCAWPPYDIVSKIQQSIEERDEPDDDWETRNIKKVIANAGI